VLSLQLARDRVRQSRGGSNPHVSLAVWNSETTEFGNQRRLVIWRGSWEMRAYVRVGRCAVVSASPQNWHILPKQAAPVKQIRKSRR
jgi:hypothetical protein